MYSTRKTVIKLLKRDGFDQDDKQMAALAHVVAHVIWKRKEAYPFDSGPAICSV
jgi:hypothetical protein